MSDERRRRWLSWSRLLDAIAVIVIAFALWKIFVAPRFFKGVDAYPAPHVSYERLGGGTFHLVDQRGKLVFLDFFATWCEPCRLQTPMVEAFAQKHPDVLVVSVDVGEPRALADNFAKKYRMTNVVLDPQNVSQGYFQVTGYPTIVVVDPQGRIRATWSGFNPAIDLAMSNAEKNLR